MKERPKNRNKITKTGDFSQRTTEKLEIGKIINRKGKKNYEEIVWQEKTKQDWSKKTIYS